MGNMTWNMYSAFSGVLADICIGDNGAILVFVQGAIQDLECNVMK